MKGFSLEHDFWEITPFRKSLQNGWEGPKSPDLVFVRAVHARAHYEWNSRSSRAMMPTFRTSCIYFKQSIGCAAVDRSSFGLCVPVWAKGEKCRFWTIKNTVRAEFDTRFVSGMKTRHCRMLTRVIMDLCQEISVGSNLFFQKRFLELFFCTQGHAESRLGLWHMPKKHIKTETSSKVL